MSKNCSNCGASLDDAAKFCAGCGMTAVQQQQPADAQQTEPIILPVGQSQAEAQQPTPKKKKSKKPVVIIAVLCAICVLVAGGWFTYTRFFSDKGGGGADKDDAAVKIITDTDDLFEVLLNLDPELVDEWLRSEGLAEIYYEMLYGGDYLAPFKVINEQGGRLAGYPAVKASEPDDEDEPDSSLPPSSKPSSAASQPEEADDPPNYNLPDKDMTSWPAEYLPKGLPKYPDGTLDVHATPGYVVIYVENTSQKSMAAYYNALKNNGWKFLSELSPDYTEGTKNKWLAAMSLDGTTLTLAFTHDSWGGY